MELNTTTRVSLPLNPGSFKLADEKNDFPHFYPRLTKLIIHYLIAYSMNILSHDVKNLYSSGIFFLEMVISMRVGN